MQSILELADCSRFKTHFQQFGVILPSHSELIIMLRMRKKACSVRGCPNQGLDATDVLHFGFPKELTRFHKWVEFCQNPTLEGRTPRQCTHKFICALHFSRDAFQNELLRKLNRNSLPSLSPPLPALSAPGASSTPSIPIPSSLVLSPSQPSTSFSTSTPTHPRCATHLFFGPSTSNSSEADLGCLPLGDSNELSFATSSAPELCGSSTVAGSSTVSSNSGKKSKSLALSHIHMTRTSEMTPRKTFLFEYGRRKDKALKRLQKKYEGNKKKLRDILYFKKQCFLKKNMSTTVATFLESQLRGYNKKPRGRRYTVDDKIMALSIYKRSPKCYTLLRKLFVLPSKRTLISMVNAVPFRTGFNAQIFTTLAQTMKQMSDCDRLCYVMFDEISLRQNLRYNSRFDFIEGLEDYGHLGRTSLPAKSALVFMLRGLVRKWKQPIAYYFSHSGVKAEILKELIQEVLRACLDAGIHVVATVCDMGSSNVKALKELGSTKHHPVFRFLDHDIVTIYDPPHLLKCTRNSLLNHDVKCTVKTASLEYRATARWDHIHTAYNSDQQFIFRSAPKLTETHINPDSRSKMRVQTAAQVLSHSVAVAVERAVAVGHLSSEALATASFVNTCDSLLDSFNGYKEHPQGGKSLKKRLEEDSPHWEFWRNASREVNSWEFLTPSNIEGQAPKVRRMPSQDGWLVSMKAMELLWAEVTKKCNKVTYLQPRCINQDALENTFGLIRSHCGSNEHPTVWQFVDALKTCIINGLAFRDILQGSNCKEDDASLLSNLRTFICGDHEPSEPKPDNVPTDDDVDDPAPVIVGADEASIPCDISRLSTAYVSGYIARRLLSHNECDDCRAALCCTNLDIYLHIGIELKEYSPDERTLTYPSEKLVCFVSQGANLIDSMLDANKKMDAVKETITRSMKEEIDFTWLSDIACGHGNDLTLRLVEALCTLCISWWCTRQNRQVKDYSKKKRKMRKLNVNV